MKQFRVVFEKLKEALEQEGLTLKGVAATGLSVQELDEIEELRRFSAEIVEPDPASFTST